MPRGKKIVILPTEEIKKLKDELVRIQERQERDSKRKQEIDIRLKELELQENSDFFELAKKIAKDKGITLLDLIKPLDVAKEAPAKTAITTKGAKKEPV